MFFSKLDFLRKQKKKTKGAGKRPLIKESAAPGDAEFRMNVTDVSTYTCHNMTMEGFAQRLPGVAAAGFSAGPFAPFPNLQVTPSIRPLPLPIPRRIVFAHPYLAPAASRHRASHFFRIAPDNLRVVPAHAATLV